MFLQISQNSQENTCAKGSFLKNLQICRVNSFIKKEIPAQMFFCESFRRLLLHKHLFCLLSHHDLWFFQKRCNTYIAADYFLDLTYRLGTRISLIFQTLIQTNIFNPVEHLRRSFFLRK